jgi:hypothetical protein
VSDESEVQPAKQLDGSEVTSGGTIKEMSDLHV